MKSVIVSTNGCSSQVNTSSSGLSLHSMYLGTSGTMCHEVFNFRISRGFLTYSAVLNCVLSGDILLCLLGSFFEESRHMDPKEIQNASTGLAKFQDWHNPRQQKQSQFKQSVPNLCQLFLICRAKERSNKSQSPSGLHPTWSLQRLLRNILVFLTSQVQKHNSFIKTTSTLFRTSAWEPFIQGFYKHTSVLSSCMGRQLTDRLDDRWAFPSSSTKEYLPLLLSLFKAAVSASFCIANKYWD